MKTQLYFLTLLLLAGPALSPAPAMACHRADCDVEDSELGPAQEHYEKAKQSFYAQLGAKLGSGDEYDRRRAQMLLKEMPGVISSNENLATKKCELVSRLIGNGKQSNIADFHCQMDEMKKTERYLVKVNSTFRDLDYPEDSRPAADEAAGQESAANSAE